MTMATCHAALIDYRFRMLPAPTKSIDDFEMVDSILDSGDQTFIENGIVVESKYELTDIEKKKIRTAKIQKKKQEGLSWQPQNITEFLFFDNNGICVTSEENVKSIS